MKDAQGTTWLEQPVIVMLPGFPPLGGGAEPANVMLPVNGPPTISGRMKLVCPWSVPAVAENDIDVPGPGALPFASLTEKSNVWNPPFGTLIPGTVTGLGVW